MTSKEEVSRIIQTQHPTLGYELQNAIASLRKLQKIAGDVVTRDPLQETFVSEADSTHSQSGGTLISDGGGDLDAGVESGIFAPGDAFGRYQITRQLGQGAMGAVYLAFDSQLDRYVALKIPFMSTADSISRFYREARSAAKIRSPNICAVYDVNQINGIHFLAMELIDGQPLFSYFKAGKLTEINEALNLVKKVAIALQSAHDMHIIHRDIKMENIMIDQHREPIIMDFGLARLVGDDEVELTKEGLLLGTPAYMSPEQTEGDQTKLGPATDIYSLGVVLYHLITGQLPFTGSVASIVAQIRFTEPPKPSSINTSIAPNSKLEQICSKMMAKSTVDRYSSMKEVADELDECLRSDKAFSQHSSRLGSLFRRWISRSE